MFLSAHCNEVNLVVRRPLAETMSNYLIERIAAQPNITLHVGSEISELHGDKAGLTGVTWRNRETGETMECQTRHLFLFIGADPNSAWLGECDAVRDRKGFVVTGEALDADALKVRAGLPTVVRRRSKRACPACSPSATCGQARSSAWRRASAKARRSSRRFHAYLAERAAA